MVADSTMVTSLGERLLASRVVVLGKAVDDAIANRLCAQLLHPESLSSTEDIWLYERVLQDWDRDHWFTPDEAVAYGLIDRVITRRRDLSPPLT